MHLSSCAHVYVRCVTVLAPHAEVFLRHTPIVGLALAAAAALATEPPVPSVACTWPAWERLGALERQLLLALPEGSEGAGMLQPMLVEAITSCQQVWACVAKGPANHRHNLLCKTALHEWRDLEVLGMSCSASIAVGACSNMYILCCWCGLQGRLQLGHVLQLVVVVYSLSGDRMPPAPPLYSADEAQLKEALADAMLAAAAAGDAQQQWLVQLECLPAAQHVLHQVGGCTARCVAGCLIPCLTTAQSRSWHRMRLWHDVCTGQCHLVVPGVLQQQSLLRDAAGQRLAVALVW